MPDGPSAQQRPCPGVVVVWTGAQPTVQVVPRPGRGPRDRSRAARRHTTDDRISRQHARDHVEGPALRRHRPRQPQRHLRRRPRADRSRGHGHAAVGRAHRPHGLRAARGRPPVRGRARSRRSTTRSSARARTRCGRRSSRPRTHSANLLIIGEPGVGKGRMARGYARVRNRPEAVFNPTIQAVPLERVVGAADRDARSSSRSASSAPQNHRRRSSKLLDDAAEPARRARPR